MKWARIGLPVLIFAGSSMIERAQALPAMPPQDTILSTQPELLQVRYRRHQYRHWRLMRRAIHEPSNDSVKAGEWQFTAALQPPSGAAGTPPTTPQTAPQVQGGAKTTYQACIASDTAVLAGIDPRCKIDSSQRQGPRITWSMSCADTRVHSEGVAQYHGDKMNGTMVSRVPGANGATDIRQSITGHYIGPCTQTAQAQTRSSTNQAGSSMPQAGPASAPPENAAQARAGESAAAPEPRERHAARHAHHHWHVVRYWHHRHHRYRY